jgi:hypothetical protein
VCPLTHGPHRASQATKSVELSVRPFADSDDRPRIVAYAGQEPSQVILGPADVDLGERNTFIEAHLREAYLDPVAGDPAARVALIATLGDLKRSGWL